jgi:hypothetical protein
VVVGVLLERSKRTMATNSCCGECGEEGGSRYAGRVGSFGIAALNAKGNTGQRTKKRANVVLPSYAMRRCSRTHLPRRTVRFASYQFQRN